MTQTKDVADILVKVSLSFVATSIVIVLMIGTESDASTSRRNETNRTPIRANLKRRGFMASTKTRVNTERLERGNVKHKEHG